MTNLAPEEKKTKRKMGPASGLRKKKKKTLGEEQYETFKSESDTQFDKAKRIQKSYEGASPKIKTDLKKRFKGTFDPEDMVASSRRDTAKTFKVGGRVGLKDGSKGCGKAKAGRGKAYGKNS
jgi:hypothetical protein